MGFFKALGRTIGAFADSQPRINRTAANISGCFTPSVGYDEIIGTSGFLLEIAPELISKVLGRLRSEEIGNGLDGYAYLKEMKIGLAPMAGCRAEYWLLRDKEDPRNEWQIWYYIPENINGMAETSLSAVLDKKWAEESMQHLEFTLELGEEDLLRIQNERKRKFFWP